MTRPRLLISEAPGFSHSALAILNTLFEVTTADLDRQELLRELPNYEILWAKLRHQLDATVLATGTKLRAIATNTTGLTHLDSAAAAARQIAVISLRGETEFLQEIRATAEHTIALLLALLRHVPAAHEHVIAGGWNRDLFAGRELFGKTAGIIGYGRLGRIVGRYLQAFGMSVLVASPNLTASECEPGVTVVSLDDLLHRSDVVSLHANVTATNLNLLGAREFALMRPGTWFINTARGELVDSAALLTALTSGHLAGAALDVLDHEQSSGMSQHPLVQYAHLHSNLIITPHLGGNTPESLEKTEVFLAKKVCAWWQQQS